MNSKPFITLVLATGFTALAFSTHAQRIDRIITVAKVSRIQQTLSADAMEGRRTFTPGIDRAADFLSREFAKAKLKPLPGQKSYLQPFTMYSSAVTTGTVQVGGQAIPVQQVYALTGQPQLTISPQSNYKIERIAAGENAMARLRNIRAMEGNMLVLMDTSFAPLFARLKSSSGARFATPHSQVWILTPQPQASQFEVNVNIAVKEHKLANVVGIIPGKSKPNEYVIFSAHYDHLGYGRPNEKGDSLYNGANDDASGTTAVTMLARYFKKQPRPQRTLVFVAFTAEEVGGFGSQYFSQQMKPADVVAMFNIEMIGTDSKWGNNSAFITGYEKSNMGQILQRNLGGTAFTFYPDPYPQQQLFYRSDNATLARLGVPAHTISTSKMDNEPHYHKPSDEYGTLDMNNMREIIKAIALSSRSIIAGADTPTRVDATQLR